VHYPKGRLDHGPPIAVIDIGSNSVRLVIYEGLTRAPTPIFNEKVLAGLDPRNGKVEAAGTVENSGTRLFKPPRTAYGQDWVLILDDVARGYALP